MSSPARADAPQLELSPGDRWNEVFRHLDLALEELEALREHVPSWAQHAFFEAMARLERTASKLRTFRKVSGMERDG